MIKPNLFLFDLETTGLGEKGERIVPVQIAAIILDPQYKELARFQAFLQIPEGAHLEPYAMEMHAKKGRTYEWFQEHGQDPNQVYADLANFCKPYGKLLPAGHNAAKFDVPILVRELLLHGYAMKPEKAAPGQVVINIDHHVLDTAGLAYSKYVYGHGKTDKVGLQAICQFLGIPLSDADAHDAMNDVLATLEVLKHMQRVISPKTLEDLKLSFGDQIDELILNEITRQAGTIAETYLNQRLKGHPILGKLLGGLLKKLLA